MITLDALRALAEADPQAAVERVLRAPSDGLLELTRFPVDRNGAGRLRRGQSILIRPGDPVSAGPMRAMLGEELVALCEVDRGELSPTRVFRAPRRRLTVPPRPPEAT